MMVLSKHSWRTKIVSVGFATLLTLTPVTAFAVSTGGSNGYQGEAAKAISLKLGSADMPKGKEILSSEFVSLLEQAAVLAGGDNSFTASAKGIIAGR